MYKIMHLYRPETLTSSSSLQKKKKRKKEREKKKKKTPRNAEGFKDWKETVQIVRDSQAAFDLKRVLAFAHNIYIQVCASHVLNWYVLIENKSLVLISSQELGIWFLLSGEKEQKKRKETKKGKKDFHGKEIARIALILFFFNYSKGKKC